MSKEYELTEPQKEILGRLRVLSMQRQDSLDLVATEGSNDSLHGLFYDIGMVSNARDEAREAHIPEIEIARAILEGMPNDEEQQSYLLHNQVLTEKDIKKLMVYFSL